jgi:hypothetical protein
VEPEPEGAGSRGRVLQVFRVLQALREPVLYLLDDALDAAVELDARPAEPVAVEAALGEAVLEIVVVGLLAAVLEEEGERTVGLARWPRTVRE